MINKTDSAFASLCRLLSRREHSGIELHRKLMARGFEKSEIEIALEKAQNLDIQNDARFANMIARTRLQQGYGPLRITMELKSHNLPSHIIHASLAEIEIEFSETIQKIFKKKYKNSGLLPQHIKWLASRGFDIDLIRKSFAQAFTAD